MGNVYARVVNMELRNLHWYYFRFVLTVSQVANNFSCYMVCIPKDIKQKFICSVCYIVCIRQAIK
jgi:hypothetical protein